MSKFKAFIARAKVIATALPTHLIAAAAAITFLLPLATSALPAYANDITLWAGRVLALLAAAVQIIRKVTPVADEQVGVLPKPPAA